MKSVVLVLAVLASVALADQINSDWQQWKTINKKSYSVAEDRVRKEIFVANAERIAAHNRLYDLGLKTHRLAINKFADLTHDEFAKKFLGGKPPARTGSAFSTYRSSGKVNADSVDWRTKDIVTDIKDQGQCGSCWSFSTTGSLEGQHALATGKLVPLSEQQLIDCTNVAPYNNGGCNGGWMNVSYQYILDNGGITGEDDYPYEGVDGQCRYDKSKRRAGVTGFKNIAEGSEKDLQDAVANVGPIAVAIEVVNDFEYYSGGVYDTTDCTGKKEALDHAVLVVGYGTDNGQDYYLVKNSWGSWWGEQGYIRMSRNAQDQCGIALAACYPLVQ